jgi:hypothetical protein
MYKKKQTVNYQKKTMVANPGFKQLRNLDFQLTLICISSLFIDLLHHNKFHTLNLLCSYDLYTHSIFSSELFSFCIFCNFLDILRLIHYKMGLQNP